MAVYFISGKLGAGKTLAAVGRIRDYLNAGRPIATNLELNIEHFADPYNRHLRMYRLPDRPTARDLSLLGTGNESYDEEQNGGIFLDECGTWFNSRTWNQPGRRALIDWFLHARKHGWDLYFIIQDISIVDRQAREALCEHLVFCRRLDRLAIPFFTAFAKLFGVPLRFPRLHLALVKYGDSKQAITVDRWLYRGASLYALFDTKQVFIEADSATYCSLTPWHLVGRYLPPRPSLLSIITRSLTQGLRFAFCLLCFLIARFIQALTGRPWRSILRATGLFRSV